MEPRYCKQCGTDISDRDRQNRYCSQSCSTKYNNARGRTGRKGKPVSDEARRRMSDGMCEWHKTQGRIAVSHSSMERQCQYVDCGKMFVPDKPTRKFCSNDCRILGRSNVLRGKISFRTFQKMFRRAFPDWVCPFCEWSETFAIHHIIPWRRGGTDDVDNLVALCPNHHSLADLGKIGEETLRSYAIGRSYSKEELIGRFYFGPAKILEVLEKQRRMDPSRRRKHGDAVSTV